MKINQRLFCLNLKIHRLCQIWQWCSPRLHPRWLHEKKYRNDLFMLLAPVLHGQADESSPLVFSHPEVYLEQTEPFFQEEELAKLWSESPNTVLNLCLGLFSKGVHLRRELEGVRQKFGPHQKLDGLVNRMLRRENSIEDWLILGYHPHAEVAEFLKLIEPLVDQIRTVILDHCSTVEQMARNFLAEGPFRMGELPASAHVRRTPVGLLNKMQRLRLWRIAQSVSTRGLEVIPFTEILISELNEAISPPLRDMILKAGHTVDQVIDDMLNFDRFLTPTELLQTNS